MNKITNFEKIRSHLEYGHKVRAILTHKVYGKSNVIFINVFDTVGGQHFLIDETGEKYDEKEINGTWQVDSITPIPHRYKKLEVGAKVDVLEYFDPTFTGHNGWTIHRYALDGTETVYITKDGAGITVPLWAITPHVEGEGKEKEEMLECIEEYEGGILVKRKINGVEMPLPPFENCKSVTFVKTMPVEEAKRMFGQNLQGTNN